MGHLRPGARLHKDGLQSHLTQPLLVALFRPTVVNAHLQAQRRQTKERNLAPRFPTLSKYNHVVSVEYSETLYIQFVLHLEDADVGGNEADHSPSDSNIVNSEKDVTSQVQALVLELPLRQCSVLAHLGDQKVLALQSQPLPGLSCRQAASL